MRDCTSDMAASRMPLGGYRVVDTADVEQARESVRQRFPWTDLLPPKDGRFHLISNHVDLGQAALTLSTSTAYETRTSGWHYYLIGPLGAERLALRARQGRAEVDVTAGRAALLQGPQACTYPTGMARLLVTLPAESVCRRLELLLGQPVIAPPAFEPAVDLSRGAGAALARALRFALSELDHAQAAAHAPLLRAALQDLLIGAMVAALPLAARDLEADPPGAAPWQVRRAEAWLAAHAAEPISIEDLARAIGVPLRTIQHAFRRARGYPPRAFLHRCRLELARRRLLEAGEGETVSSVALDCGFGHFGDFAAAYKARFGETPSATLQLRRR